ncbi:sulfotransferase [Aliidiomarina halalkaliphila]|uniref:Sulfotransferase n=1 Tax=Aliidiomarina halalkaliphila TaxID=2593535 RepID=A0A552X5A4_9GAMM|nr:sulfotransferase [Aliidiomarina halalkaliphila]TRW50194.1 sulfotransferase [Aliidiomarina halalkaliphila]
MLNKNKINIISVSGYGWSGSSAVVDFMKGFKDTKAIETEFRLLKDPGGIMDLESALLDNWDVMKNGLAINDFITLINILNRKHIKMFQMGGSYGVTVSNDFLRQSYDYINDLVDFKFNGDSLIFDYSLSRFQYFLKRVRKRVLRAYAKEIYFSKPSREAFRKATQSYLSCVLRDFANKHECRNVVLDQAIPASNIKKSLSYFDKIKIIIVDRDPRDVYCDMYNHKSLIYSQGHNEIYSVNNFIKWFRAQRDAESQRGLKGEILKVKFEDLVNDYAVTSEIIKDFIGLDMELDPNKRCFHPEKSIKNIGIYKNHSNKKAIELIDSELNEYYK